MSTNKSLLAAAIAVFACGAANADMVAYNGTVAYPGATSSPANTDFTYSITLPDFNPTLGTLTGVTIIFYAQENVSSVTMSNGGTNTSTNFTFSENSNVTSGFSNSAVATDVFSGGRTLTPYSLGPITLGGTSAPTTNCPDSTPSASCNTVTYSGLNVEDDVVDSQTNGGFATFTGTNGPGPVSGSLTTIITPATRELLRPSLWVEAPLEPSQSAERQQAAAPRLQPDWLTRKLITHLLTRQAAPRNPRRWFCSVRLWSVSV